MIISKATLKNRLFVALMILPFLEPEIFNFYPKIHIAFFAFEFLNMLLLLIMFLYKKQFSVYLFLIIIWRIYLMVVTYISSGYLSNAVISRTVMIIGIVLVIDIGFSRSYVDTLWGIYLIMITLSIINLITCIMGGLIQRNGIPYYLFGLRTRFTDSAIPIMIVSILISWISKKKLFSFISYFSLVVVGLQLINQWVATGIFVIVALVAFILIGKNYNFRYPAITSTLLSFFFLVSVVFFRIQNYFSFIIENILNKSLDLHGRIDIWNDAISIISLRKWFGYGEIGDGGFIPVWWSYKLAPAHDMLLQVLHDGGLISCVILLIILMYAVNQTKHSNVIIANILVSGMIALIISVLTEITYYYSYFYIVPVLCAYSVYIKSSKSGVNE
ncbi:hypothetical protein EGT49_08190 [Companilactobacillus suantsaicola]|uniref:O-antigen ligase-related domain-containing protein n=1 Tax=Companilactobacillus suantsaicola TaxID=2487723 RepID=A0A4Z0JIE4_9LACO|nr:O-antigen ligase family protein [Companilactobacillus suantsaicola]TGD22750.1 hypothetical protein EGT49_08190 [Companilactobacillus suantsaicola]